MALDTDGKHKILLFRGIHGVQDMADQNIVLRPAVLRLLQDIHELLAGKAVKAHVIKYPGTAVEVSAIVVERMCPVAKRA